MHFANEDALRAKGPATSQPKALPWAGLFAHRWCPLQMRSKVHDRLLTPRSLLGKGAIGSVISVCDPI